MPQLRLAIGDATATSKTIIETVGETRKTSLPTADEYIQLAEKEFRNKEWRKASENYTGAIIKDEKNDKYYCFRAKCFTEMGDHNKAIDDYSTAIKLNSNNHEALNNRGLSRSRLSYFRDARDDFYTAYNITKNESYFDNWLSVVEKLKDNATLDEYLMHDGSYKDKVYFCRGKIQIEKGNLNEGKADIIKSKELGNYESKEWLKSNSWWGKMNDSSNPSITDKHPKTFWIIFVLSILLIWIISKILNS
jgi:tetratricopeptide (TPR) repeat protein